MKSFDMRNTVLACAFGLTAMVATECAAQAGKPAVARKIPSEERWLIHEAGMVDRREEGPALCIVDMRAEEKVGGLAATAKKIEDFTRLIIPVEKHQLAEGGDAAKSAFSMLGEKRGAVVAIVDDAVSPSMTVFPEDGVAVVNVGRLGKDLPEKDATAVLEGRFAREVWRAVAFVLGGYETEYRCIVKNIREPAELDKLPRNTCPPASEKISEGAAKLKLARVMRVTYASAVLDGCAPPPETEAQKAIVQYYTTNNMIKAKSPVAK